MKYILFLLILLPFQVLSTDLEVRNASEEEISEIEKSMDQMKFTIDPDSVTLKNVLITDNTFCGRMDATKKNGSKITWTTIYGSWFNGQMVAPISTGVAARRMCDLDKFPKN